LQNSVIKKIPERKCIGCSEKKAKKDLIRIVRLPDGKGVELDKTGRVTLNQSFKEYANIVKDIVVVGVSSRIELWAQEEWDKESENFNECLKTEIEIRF
jgi:DNA-binding transcriptional regulator/RsmH inhibitor MraZ